MRTLLFLALVLVVALLAWYLEFRDAPEADSEDLGIVPIDADSGEPIASHVETPTELDPAERHWLKRGPAGGR